MLETLDFYDTKLVTTLVGDCEEMRFEYAWKGNFQSIGDFSTNNRCSNILTKVCKVIFLDVLFTEKWTTHLSFRSGRHAAQIENASPVSDGPVTPWECSQSCGRRGVRRRYISFASFILKSNETKWKRAYYVLLKVASLESTWTEYAIRRTRFLLIEKILEQYCIAFHLAGSGTH